MAVGAVVPHDCWGTTMARIAPAWGDADRPRHAAIDRAVSRWRPRKGRSRRLRKARARARPKQRIGGTVRERNGCSARRQREGSALRPNAEWTAGGALRGRTPSGVAAEAGGRSSSGVVAGRADGVAESPVWSHSGLTTRRARGGAEFCGCAPSVRLAAGRPSGVGRAPTGRHPVGGSVAGPPGPDEGEAGGRVPVNGTAAEADRCGSAEAGDCRAAELGCRGNAEFGGCAPIGGAAASARAEGQMPAAAAGGVGSVHRGPAAGEWRAVPRAERGASPCLASWAAARRAA